MQNRNYRRNVNFTHNGRTMCLTDWAVELELSPGMVYQRVSTYKWTIEQALELVPRQKNT